MSTTDNSMMLADVYADSLLLAAADRERQEEIASQLADLVAYMGQDPAFTGFLTSDSIDDDPRRESLEKLFRGKMDDLLLNLLQVMNDRRRLSLVRELARCVELRMQENHHQQEVTVETAVPLTDDLRGQLRDEIGRRIGKEALLIERVRPELIGGVVIHIGDMQIDGSVASRIRLMRRRLTDRTREEIHNNARYVLET